MTKTVLIIISVLLSITCHGQITFTCNYLNEPEPGDEPLIFGKGTVSIDGKNTHACTFSPDGKMLLFSRYPDRKSYMMKFDNGQWTGPEEAFFEGKETSFSSDGNKVFYYANGGDLFYNERKGESWGPPINVGASINTSETEYYPSVTNDGTLFFSRAGNWSDGRIMYSTCHEGKYNNHVDIGLPVNTGGALHAYIAPDKSYMLFNSPRKGSHTQLDIWISFHKADGSWTEPHNLGETINSGADAILCPTVTPNGKYLFFTKLNLTTHTGYVYWVSTKTFIHP
jgi:Tol biopolymer transport system component